MLSIILIMFSKKLFFCLTNYLAGPKVIEPFRQTTKRRGRETFKRFL